MAYITRLSLLVVSLVLWLESRAPKWRGALDHRLLHFPYQCEVVGRWATSLVFRLYRVRSSSTRLLAPMEPAMGAVEPVTIEVCSMCRAALHTKCDRIEGGTCLCQCERGY